MSKKDTQAQRYQGMVNRAQGKLFEERIDVALAYYDRLGVASVEKTPEPMRPIKRLQEGRFIAVFEKPAQPDYKGTMKGGRAVVFEAKHTSTGQMEQSRVTEAQAKRLEHHQELGALCFVVAGFGSEEVFRVPWKVWRDMKAAFGRKYVTPKDLEEYRVKLGPAGVLLLLDMVKMNLTVNYAFNAGQVVELYKRFNGMDGESLVANYIQNSIIAYVKEVTPREYERRIQEIARKWQV